MPNDLDFLAAIERESRRFGVCLQTADPEARVPTCPEWSAADLLWHLTEVQLFWAAIVHGRLDSPDAAKALMPGRPEAFSDLLRLYDRASNTLIEDLGACESTTPMWTWFDQDQTAGFVRRRQAHEALIHRLDAEAVTGAATPIDLLLAVDGVDEVLCVMFGEAPPWGAVTPSGGRGVVAAVDTARSWGVGFGRLIGTSPNTGTIFDEAVLTIGNPPTNPEFIVAADAATLDTWLWNRPASNDVQLTGSADGIERFVEVIRGGVQ